MLTHAWIHTTVENKLIQYAYEIEHWLDHFLTDNKSATPEQTVQSVQTGLRKQINFSEFKPKEISSFVTTKSKKVSNTHKWIKNNQTKLKMTIQTYLTQHPHATVSDIYNFLNTHNNPVCQTLQRTLHKATIAPWMINNAIKDILQNMKVL